MGQTSWIAGSLFLGFIVYVTIKGELSQYKEAIFGSGAGATAATATEQTGYQNQDPSIGPVTKAK